MFKKTVLVLIVLILILCIVIAMQPADFSITRSIKIAAPPQVVFAQVNDFHNWPAWSPWAKLDPDMKSSIDGPSSGAGSKYSWAGNSKVGEGSMTITDSHPSDSLRINLEFLKPFKGSNITDFTFKPESDQTTVTWTMSGKKGFIQKGFCLFMNMEKMVGPDFEKGLAQLKTVCENVPRSVALGQ